MSHTLDRPSPALVVAQPRKGFRYGAEAFWLVGFALEDSTPDSALDLGTGSGIMAMLLGAAGVPTLGVDLRSEWEPLWAMTLARSRTKAEVRLELADVASGLPGRSAELVISNPPFFAAGSGPEPSARWKSAARFESSATLARFVQVGLEALEPGGRMCVVVPVERASELAVHTTRSVAVGRRRMLLELRPGVHGGGPSTNLDERDPRVLGWYERLGAGLPP